MRNRIVNTIPYIISAIALIITSCTKPYNPPAIKSVTGYLVVEGVINIGNDSSRFRLSRTVALDSAVSSAKVTGAQVTVEGNDNSTYSFVGNSAGVYTSAPLNLSTGKQYRLHIKTTDGKDYLSDYVSPKITPPIDTINYQIQNTGLAITLNTHDPANNTKYYRWDFTETWEFHSKYESDYVSNGDTVISRTLAQYVYFCYANDASNSILLGSSAKLSQDVITQAPITFIPQTSEKIETDYSILVSQYALTSDAYNFWTNLKKNTEQLGSIFDVQPSTIDGNIHCTTNPNEPVIGYISASTIQTKRIFVNNTVLPHSWVPTYPYDCEADSILLAKVEGNTVINQENQYFNANRGAIGLLIPIEAITNKFGTVIGHTGSDIECVDCTTRGTVTPPSFWK